MQMDGIDAPRELHDAQDLDELRHRHSADGLDHGLLPCPGD
jgi:hypothetical protein